MSSLKLPESQIRPMVDTDLPLVLGWRNHADVRRYMFSQHEITLAEHINWFQHSLCDPNKHMLIFEIDFNPVGYVNFTATENTGISNWGFYTAPNAPKGIGRELGCKALNYAFSKLKIGKVIGQALAHNEPSIKMHIALGFQQEGILLNRHFDGACLHDVICFGMPSHAWLQKE